jgi:hypothetical protein
MAEYYVRIRQTTHPKHREGRTYALTFCQRVRTAPSGTDQPAIRRERLKDAMMEYLGFVDLQKRWVYSRQGLYKLMAKSDFPPPAFVIAAGRTKVWCVTDIEAYERTHPETVDPDKKHHKIVGYLKAVSRG